MNPTVRAVLGTALAAGLAVTGLASTATASEAPAAPSGPTIRNASSPTAIPGSYVVVLAGNRSAAETRVTTQSLAASYDVKVRRQFSSSIKGFSANMSEDQAKKVAGDPRVAFVQQNQKITANQDNPPWGLDRTD